MYQQVRLACDEFDVVGLAFPGVPGVQHFGHTGTAAWGITNAIAHHVEVFRERLSDDGAAALGPDGWAPVARHTETIRVRGGADVAVDVVETDRGPLVLDGLSVRFPARVGLRRRVLLPAAAAPVAVRRRRGRRPCAAGSTRSTGCSPPTPTARC